MGSRQCELDAGAVLRTLREVLPAGGVEIPLHEPRFAGREWDYVKETLDSGWVSSAGGYVERFEAHLADLCEVPHAIACVNGTAALHLCLRLAGVERGDEVLLPALTFVATANAAAYLGAVPHFVDSEERTLSLDPAKLADHLAKIALVVDDVCRNRLTGRRIVAVVPMHTLGHPVDMDPLAEVAVRYRLAVVEDAAEALGSRYKGRPAGALAHLAAVSFNGNKIVTTGGGGAILTHDRALAERAKHLTTTAKQPHLWAFLHDQIGYNYRMPNLNAALGCAQLEQLPGHLAAKRRLAARYLAAFAEVPGVTVFQEPDFARSNYWLNALLLDPSHAARLDALLDVTNSAGIQTRPLWTPLHRLPMFADCPRMRLDCAEDLARRLIKLPSSPGLAPNPAEAAGEQAP